ncbi:glyoxalase family protein [Ruegeria sp. TrichCH4B]|jgi:catechol 2,3-dioxygenase-like lactoylglutathione lyase family enzyme|nr:glyoxalase family protein [Ruegeria sp. TrichCH4B]
MLESVDRILVVVNDLDEAQNNYSNILGATLVRDYRSDFLAADVRVLELGKSWVELVKPNSDGPAMKRLQRAGEGLLFGGVSVSDLDPFSDHLNQKGIKFTKADGRIYLDGGQLYGLPLAVSKSGDRPSGQDNALTAFLYELTVVLKTQWTQVAEDYSKYFGLDAERRVGITFPRFGYEGSLLMFGDESLDRIELSEAHDPAFPMGRFSSKHGDGLYMCYVETNDLAEVISRLERHSVRYVRRTDTPVERDGLWLHPSALNGVLMGVSRKTLAWQWSGKPDLVEPLD